MMHDAFLCILYIEVCVDWTYRIYKAKTARTTAARSEPKVMLVCEAPENCWAVPLGVAVAVAKVPFEALVTEDWRVAMAVVTAATGL